MTRPLPPVWCTSCGVHYALPSTRQCPVCLDDRGRARKDPK